VCGCACGGVVGLAVVVVDKIKNEKKTNMSTEEVNSNINQV
jgi:hypothetical protein